jgi:hypothetical protein
MFESSNTKLSLKNCISLCLNRQKPTNFKLAAMGFDLELAKLCLKAFKNNLQKAINFFLENKLNPLEQQEPLHFETMKEKLKKLINENKDAESEERPGTSKDLEKCLNANELLNNLANEIPDDDEAYLDFDLDEDTFFINKYYSLL